MGPVLSLVLLLSSTCLVLAVVCVLQGVALHEQRKVIEMAAMRFRADDASQPRRRKAQETARNPEHVTNPEKPVSSAFQADLDEFDDPADRNDEYEAVREQLKRDARHQPS